MQGVREANPRLLHDKHPKHPLTLSPSVPYRDNRFSCKVCNQWYSTSDQWVYRCESCKFDVHLDCLGSANMVTADGLSAVENKWKLDLPTDFREKSAEHDDMTHYLKVECESVLSSVTYLVASYSMSAPPLNENKAYKCDTCDDYVLHVRCALFPENFQHDFHNHQLSLIPNVADDFTCKACAKRIQGFAYHCDTCADDYSLHPICSSAHEKVQHDKHAKHPLTLSASVPYRNNRFECKVCKKRDSTSDQWIYRCASCKFDVHLDCASSAKVVAVAAAGASSNGSRRGRSNVLIPIGVRVASKAASSAVAGATRKAVGATEHVVHSAGDAVSGAFGKVVGFFGDAFGD
ncbi:hypothetical protein QJS10_CPB15g00158 [Acorus calamus]|uniref:DC1 domain-containing protein n=1 Tax=Acorus calamus TaxID=4465 RepID=A0AAV9D4K2_ACOCL|nr:hypothetical protein QJS10_CPB15g00158 [Acorus calamus]